MESENDGLIVIVGGGFAGAYCAQRLEKLLGRGASRVLLMDRNNYFVFSPLLIEAGTGSLEPRHAVVSIRSFLKRARFLMAEVTGVDFAARRVRYRAAGDKGEQAVRYEHLVLAPGSVTALPPIPGLAEHGYEMKSLADAVGLRDRAIEMLERADAEPDAGKRAAMLHFVVAGASFTGVEVAGEFDVFLHQAARRYPRLNPGECRVTLVERSDRILPALDDDLAEYATRRLRERNIEVVLGASIAKVAADHVELSACMQTQGDRAVASKTPPQPPQSVSLHAQSPGRRIETHTTIWCAGIAPSGLLAGLELPKDSRGYLLCEPDLRVKGRGNVWGIGDCAVNTDARGVAYPATAQHAVREGVAAAENIVAVMRGRATRPFVYKSRGSLAPLGCRTAVAKVGPLKLSGLPAWVMWRTVYLLKMPGAARKLRVALDWTLDWFFRRDYVQLGVRRPPRH